jgi:hypothetical protein
MPVHRKTVSNDGRDLQADRKEKVDRKGKIGSSEPERSGLSMLARVEMEASLYARSPRAHSEQRKTEGGGQVEVWSQAVAALLPPSDDVLLQAREFSDVY